MYAIPCSLWEVIEPSEAADICSRVSEPGSAAKELLDLAQAYGSRQAVSVIVVQLKAPLDVYQNSSPGAREECAILNMVQNHSNDFVARNEHSEKVKHKVKDMTALSQRVKFSTKNTLEGSRNQGYTTKSRKDYRESFLCNGINKIKIPCEDEHSVLQNIGDLERSSPSGQSQSDCSEYSPDNDKEPRTKFVEFSEERPKDVFQPYTANFSTHSRRKSKNDKKVDVGSQVILNDFCGEEKTVSYYHYPRPEPTSVLPQATLQHLQLEPQTGVLAPPAGFGDPASDSEGSDSGLSGVSGIQNYADHPSGANMENTMGDNSSEQVRLYTACYLFHAR